jgi:hypothetical protein
VTINPSHTKQEKAVNLLQRLCQSAPRGSSNAHRKPNRLRARPFLEGLETRLAPANVFVVPMSQAIDGAHFHSLGAAIEAIGPSGVVTVEPGASPDSFEEPVEINEGGITIQGDPNVPASILPAYLLIVDASAVKLQNLNIISIELGPTAADTFSADTVNGCLIGHLTSHVAKSVFTQNTFTDSANFDQVGPEQGGDLIANNTFTAAGDPPLSLNTCLGTVIQHNTFFMDGSSNPSAISLVNCGNGDPTVPVVVANNTITYQGPSAGTGIGVIQYGTGFSSVKILNNRIDSNNHGRGLVMEMTLGDAIHFSALVQGNDFHNNAVGVTVIGDGTAAGNIDMGGGPLGSLGGNDFRGFALPTSAFKAAIEISKAPSGTVVAKQNIFSAGVTPSDVTFGGPQGGIVDVLSPLSSQRAYVQTLYNEVLGRTGSLPELDSWVAILNSQGQAAVAKGILRSSEALGQIVDGFYLRFLGRQSDPGGRANWISFLQHGGTEEQLENLFLTSPEYQSHINTDFVQSLYINILGRTGSASELAGWNSQLQQLGLGGIASGFTQSAENRADTVLALFQTFLHRVPGTAETSALVNSSADLLSLEGMVLSSSEFFTNG